MKTGENPRMTLSRMSPAYALFNRRPNPPQPSDVLAADPPARQQGTEDTAECLLPATAAAASEPIVQVCSTKAPLETATIAHLNILGGREKQKFEHLRETKDLAAAWPPETGLRIKVEAIYALHRGRKI
jgi:hypothetical protein